MIEDNSTEIIPLLRKYGDKVENIVDLTKKYQNIDVLDIVKNHSDEPEYVVKLFDYKPYTVECEQYIQPDKYNETAPCPKEVPDIDYNKDWEHIMIYGYNGE